MKAPRVGRPSVSDAAQIETRILTAAWDVLMARGLENFSIDQVAVLAQASKRTIYARFGDRSALYRRMIELRSAAFIDATARTPRGHTLADTLTAQTIAVLAFVRSAEGRALTALEERSSGGEAGVPVRRSVHDRAILIVSDILRTAGPGERVADADIVPAATFWVAGLVGYGRMIGGDPGRGGDDAAWAERYTRWFLRAVLPDRPRDG